MTEQSEQPACPSIVCRNTPERKQRTGGARHAASPALKAVIGDRSAREEQCSEAKMCSASAAPQQLHDVEQGQCMLEDHFMDSDDDFQLSTTTPAVKRRRRKKQRPL
jgi:hypothetical protein